MTEFHYHTYTWHMLLLHKRRLMRQRTRAVLWSLTHYSHDDKGTLALVSVHSPLILKTTDKSHIAYLS